jgi:hypothetical protein
MTTTTISFHGTGRILGLLLASLLAWALGMSVLTPSATYAAPAERAASTIPTQTTPGKDPIGSIGDRMETLAKNIAKIATPIAILCIVLVLVLYLFAPILPDIAQQNKGYIMRALCIVALIGLIPEIVKFAGGLTAAS